MSSVKLTHLGHACFRVDYGDFSFVVDPFADGSAPGFPNIREKADAVYCSHGHGDHNFAEGVALSGKAAPADYEMKELEGFHDHHEGTKRGKNIVRRFNCGGISVVHMGDVGCIPSEEIIELCRGCDVLLIPVGGHFTVDAEEAWTITEMIAPRCAVPMHYRGDGFGFPIIGTADAYAAHFDKVTHVERSFTVDENGPTGCILTL